MQTKQFSLRTILSVTTDRLLTESEGPRDNGIGKLYQILSWMTDNTIFTHQIPRACAECKPWLYRWFPELAAYEAGLPNLDSWLASSSGEPESRVVCWLSEMRLANPNVKDFYDVPQLPADGHVRKNPLEELIEMRGTDEGVIVAETE